MSLGFRRLERSDFTQLAQWLAAPHVARWWRQGHDPADVEAEYGPAVDGEDPTEVFVVELDGRSIGLIQRYRLDDNAQWTLALAPSTAPSDAVGIDYLIGPEHLIGRGLGGRVIAGFVIDTWSRYPDLSAIVVAVQQANRRSWALEKAGFDRIWAGTLASDDPGDDGPSYIFVLDHPGPR
jgi:aminoglycoside 6'-N-acetyltransferase